MARRTQKGINKGLLAIIGAIVLVVVGWLIGWGVTGQINPVQWFKQPAPVEDDDKNNVIDGNLIENGVGLLSRRLKASEYAANGVSEEGTESAYVLTITRTPSDSDVTNFTWAGAFANANSSWASGKALNDYITVTPAKDNLSATVVCKQAFGEPVLVTVTYDFNTEITATRKFDYVKRVEGLTVTTAPYWINANYDYESNEHYPEYTVTYGVGTVTPTVTVTPCKEAWFQLSDEAYNYITSADSPAYKYYAKALELVNNEIVFTKESNIKYKDDNPDNGDYFNNCSPENFFQGWTYQNQTHREAQKYIRAAFKILAENKTNQFRSILKATFKYGDFYTTEITGYSAWTSIDPSYIETSVLSLSGITIPEGDYAF